MILLTPALTDADKEAQALRFEQALAAEELRGLELLRQKEREKELVLAGDPEVWP